MLLTKIPKTKTKQNFFIADPKTWTFKVWTTL